MGQTETYTVTLAPFSSNKYDEFSPVYYKDGIVFCSNQNLNSIINYTGSQNKGFFKIYYFNTKGNSSGLSPKLFSRSLSSKLNDGPVTFNSKEDTIYFSRNLEVNGNPKEISGPRNKLGIFSAHIAGNEWTKIREFRLNSEWYNLTAPYLSPDGRRLYFASDKPGGYGGSDLYFCQWMGSYWADPVNLGSVINTQGNESYPFINSSGELFFSSDRHPGLGGKDIFFSRFSDTAWIEPVHLDPPINSSSDDFGIITDSLMSTGFFSSNRNKSIDIYHFKTNYPQIFYSTIQKENQYCFMFSDKGQIIVDTANLQFMWSFGDGKTANRSVAKHCFPGPGKYNVKLDIVEKGTGKLFFTKLIFNLELKDFEQPYINSSDVSVKGDIMEFDGLKSYLPGYKVLSYSWDFGDGIRSSGENVRHSYKEKGEYKVNLELTLKSGSDGNFHKTGISKKISILNDRQEKAPFLAKMGSVKTTIPDIKNYENASINPQYSAETELQQDAVFTVELLSSKNKVGLNSSIFRNIPARYSIKEKLNPDDNNYHYIVDQQVSLMATYPAYRDLLALGFKDVVTKIFVLKDPSEKELYYLIKTFGPSSQTCFDSSDKLTSNAYIMLDQVVKLMNKYPGIRLEVAVYSDNIGSEENNLSLSQKHSQLLVNYLINRGIIAKRLVATGFGESKPIASNFLEKDRKLNRRINFVIIN
jgi:outer membrane protein OmpA-like peptidoglycan-associated protein